MNTISILLLALSLLLANTLYSNASNNHQISNVINTLDGVPEEVEQNNTYQTANTIELNGSIKGSIDFYLDFYDYYTFTTTTDGSIKFSLQPSLNFDAYIDLYDQNGEQYIARSSQLGQGLADTLTFPNLKAGKYYVAIGGGGSGNGTYVLENIFTPISKTNDLEPNNNSNTANFISNTSLNTGHLGYFGNGETDFYDWYKFTTSTNGAILFKIIPTNKLDNYLDLYDTNGESFIARSYESGLGIPDSLYFPNLKAGTYYLRVGGGGYGAYDLTSLFVPTMLANGNDTEPNNKQTESLTLVLNGITTGNLGYFGEGETDFYDWFNFTIPTNGHINLKVDPEKNLDAYLDLYDTNGESFIARSIQTGNGKPDSIDFPNLKQGTYFIRVGGGGYGSYTFSNKFTPPTYSTVNEVEPNNSQPEANSLSIDQPFTGHIGYFGMGLTDYYDWFKLAVPAHGSLQLRISPDESFDGYIELYDIDGTSYMERSTQQGKGNPSEIIYPNLNPGNYYLKIGGAGYGAYVISNIFTPSAISSATEIEPNNSPITAYNIMLNEINTGHINYFGNGTMDHEDWLKFSISSTQNIKIVAIPDPDFDVYFSLYGNEGNDYLKASTNQPVGIKDSLLAENLTTGNYYIKVEGENWGAYSLNIENYNSLGNKQLASLPFTVYSNSALNTITIVNNSNYKAKAEIFDTKGSLLIQQELLTNNNIIHLCTKQSIVLVKIHCNGIWKATKLIMQ